jgi:hypothetical protein
MLWLMISSLRPLAAEWSGYGCILPHGVRGQRVS